MKEIFILLIPLISFSCNKPVVIKGKITNYANSFITVNGKCIKVLKTDSISNFLIKEPCASGGSYFNINLGFNINIFAEPGNKINLEIDNKTHEVRLSGDEKNLNEQIINHERYFDTIKNKIDKLNLFAGEFGIFRSKIDSMFKMVKNIENAPEMFKRYENLRENCIRAKLYYEYAFNHSLINHTRYTLPENFNSFVPRITFNDPGLLYITEFSEFTGTYIDGKGKLSAFDNSKGYTDNILTNIKLDIVQNEFKDWKLKNMVLEQILLDHIKSYGFFNSDDIITRIDKLGEGSMFKNKISLILKSNQRVNADFKVEIYKKREKYNLKAYIFKHDTKSEGQQPVVCCFFGGGWYEGSPEQFFDCCRFFTEKGFVAISFEYSIKGRFNSTPVEALQDVKSAIRWTRRNARNLNIDPDNLTAIGWSAGGHLAAAATLIKNFNDPKEDSVISEQPENCILIAPCFEPLKDNWFYYQLDNKCDPRLLSPTQNIKKANTKFLCLFGTKDEFNPLYTATDFDSLMKKHDNNCRLIIKEGYHHNGFMNRKWYEFMFEFINGNTL